MLEFRDLHNEVYSRLRYGSNSIANGKAVPVPRKRRQTTPPGECVCDAQNACPPGEKGVRIFIAKHSNNRNTHFSLQAKMDKTGKNLRIFLARQLLE